MVDRQCHSVIKAAYKLTLTATTARRRYVPTSGKLTVGILECRRLKKMDITGASGKEEVLNEESLPAF